MKILITLLCIFAGVVKGDDKLFKIFAAVQNVGEIYLSYLPYTNICSYNKTNTYPGKATLQLMNQSTLFEHFLYQDMLSFWAPIKNGYSIMIGLQQQSTGQSGYILYNSKLSYFTRPIILYNITNTGLIFSYVLPSVNISTMAIQYKLIQQLSVQLIPQAQQLLKNCSNVTYQNFAYVGNETFLFVCGEVAQGFTFVPGQAENNVNMHNFTLYLQQGLYQVASRAQIISDPLGTPNTTTWTCLLLFTNTTNNNSQLYFIAFDNNYTNFTMHSMAQMQKEIYLLISRVWGYEINLQLNRWMDVFNSLNLTQANIQQYFPGNIASVFVSDRQNIFVEWTTYTGVNYLCVFNNQGQLYWNISYNGSIFYYGSRATFIYNPQNDAIYMLQIQRPIYTLSAIDFPDETAPQNTSKKNITFQCQQSLITIQYEIYWTTPLYPSGYIKSKNTSLIYSTDVVYGFELDDKFDIIGPDFHPLLNSEENIKTIVIDYSSVIINSQNVGIINVQIYNRGIISVIIVTNNTIYQINNQYQIKVITITPCGFSTVTTIQKTSIDTYIITNDLNEKCSCNLDFSTCTIVTNSYPQTQTQTQTLASSNTFSYYNSNLYLYSDNNYLGGHGTILVRKNLYGLITQGLYLSILQNNSVILVQVKTGNILNSIYMACLSLNITNGDVYLNEFYDPILLLFCQGQSSLSQFIIRQNIIIFQRQIPLYGYKTRSGLNTFFPASVHVFISVDPIKQIYPPPDNCCVLRINPTLYTVSAIVEVIDADSILGVFNVKNIDIALLRATSQLATQYIIQSYYPRTWITLNQSNSSQIVTPIQYIIISFSSPKFNFYVLYSLQVMFNLTEININFTKAVQNLPTVTAIPINLTRSDNSLSTNTYTGSLSYNFSQLICGPVFSTIFYRSDSVNTNFQIEDEEVLKTTKQIGQVGIQYIQVIDPFKWNVVNCSLNILMLFVQKFQLTVYVKLFNGIQMQYLTTLELPQQNCKYYLYQLINETAASLISNCQGISYNYNSPLLVINYNLTTNAFTSNYTQIIFSLTLRQMFTVVRNNYSTLIIGIQEGPMSSLTGRLIICNNQTKCSPMFVSTKLIFLINYGAYSSPQLYIVMSIDVYTIQVFINPQVQPNRGIILSNYTFNYTNFIKEPYCSTIRILNTTYTQAYVLISCKNHYYFMLMNFTSLDMQVLTKYTRYSQCDYYDQFRPACIFKNNTIYMLFAQCRQNGYIFRLQEYETINSSTVIIYTGYMQVFSYKGPLSPNCQKDSLSPQKIIPLSSSMNLQMFIQYQLYLGNNIIYKFIYSPINGILIDNIANFDPKLTVIYTNPQNYYELPTFYFIVFNQYHQLSQQLSFYQNIIPQNQYTPFNIFVLVLFIIVNITTFIFLICFFKHKKARQMLNDLRQQDEQSNDGDKQICNKDLRKLNLFSTVDRKQTAQLKQKLPKKRVKEVSTRSHRPTQIQMYFVKRQQKVRF